MKASWIIVSTAIAAVVSVAAGSSPASADPAADRCGGAKEKAAGRYVQSLLACHASATRRGTGVDPACTMKAGTKLAGAFDKAELTGGCATTGDSAAVGTALATDADAVVAALVPAANDAARLCAASKTKAAGKEVRAVLTCYASGAVQSIGPDAGCLARANTKLIGAYSKAETRGGCTTVGDDATIDGLDTTSARDAVRAVSPVCGDDITGPTQVCEAGDDAACPGLCASGCECRFCGDGVAELPEQCDDGGNVDGDGCSHDCRLENASALCAGVPATAGTAINAVLVRSDFVEPIYVTAVPLDPARLFVVERAGRIRILNLEDNSVEATPFLDIQSLVGTSGEGGLLSMAFDPGYATNRRFFLNYTDHSLRTVIARYETSTGDPNVADPSSAKTLLVIDQPFSNHKGGQLQFGADGYLYIGMGDGGSADDPFGNGQSDTTLLAKMLRMDVSSNTAPYWTVPPTNPHYVDGTSELELIWAKGLRNPWRFSFDRATGDLLIGDVGQNTTEEIDFQPVSSTGGENYGWRTFEGSTCYLPDPGPTCPMPPTGFTFPIDEYTHADGSCAITGGFVYRGCAMPDLRGNYFYSDYCSNVLKTIQISGGMAINPQDRTADANSNGSAFDSVVSFGEDARGELYVVMQGGTIYRIEPE